MVAFPFCRIQRFTETFVIKDDVKIDPACGMDDFLTYLNNYRIVLTERGNFNYNWR